MRVNDRAVETAMIIVAAVAVLAALCGGMWAWYLALGFVG